MGALKIVDPQKWEKAIRDAMWTNGGRVYKAAKVLDVSFRTLFRWLEDPRFADVERAPTGLHEYPRKPRKSKA